VHVSKGRHVHRRLFSRTWVLVLLIVAGTLLIGGGATAYSAYRYEQANAHKVLPGIRVAGVDVGGMTRSEAISAVRAQVDVSLSSGVTIRSAGKHWQVTPAELGVQANIGKSVQQAMAVGDSLPWWSRAYHRFADKPIQKSTDVRYDYDQAKVEDFVQQVAGDVQIPARDAGVQLVDGQIVFQKAKPGRALKAPFGADRLLSALQQRQPQVTLPVKKVQPQVTDHNVGATLVINLSENRLYLYNGFKVEKTYPVATAMPGFTTPTGSWQIVNKVENPTWVNPAPTGWGAGEPASIPPGPGNPLGTRALYLNAPGIRIHGTYDTSSVGTYASHGCIRMTIADSEDLYPRVPVGTAVLITR
jgi:lipoprotein-anchoring transpeptidase ErfK/SrfK